MGKPLQLITGICLLSSAVLWAADETVKETTQESPQILLEQALKKTEDKQTASSPGSTIPIIKSVMNDDPSVLVFVGLEDYASGSLARAVSNVAMLQKLTAIDDKLQQIVDVLSNQKNQ